MLSCCTPDHYFIKVYIDSYFKFTYLLVCSGIGGKCIHSTFFCCFVSMSRPDSNLNHTDFLRKQSCDDGFHLKHCEHTVQWDNSFWNCQNPHHPVRLLRLLKDDIWLLSLLTLPLLSFTLVVIRYSLFIFNDNWSRHLLYANSCFFFIHIFVMLVFGTCFAFSRFVIYCKPFLLFMDKTFTK